MKYKVGDRVKCIVPTSLLGNENILLGKVYTVSHVFADTGNVRVAERDQRMTYGTFRFELLTGESPLTVQGVDLSDDRPQRDRPCMCDFRGALMWAGCRCGSIVPFKE